jgi:hypothetical protein
MVLIFLLLSGCNSNNDVKNGTYFMEVETEADIPPYVTISDNKISFTYDLLSSYLPRGNYSIDDDILTMTTDDSKYVYVFQIDGDNLIFQKSRSSLVNLKDDEHGVKITDKAKFHLKDD